jgi:hypothetical protein
VHAHQASQGGRVAPEGEGEGAVLGSRDADERLVPGGRLGDQAPEVAPEQGGADGRRGGAGVTGILDVGVVDVHESILTVDPVHLGWRDYRHSIEPERGGGTHGGSRENCGREGRITVARFARRRNG